jgi:phosphoglycolate phosphatase
MLIAFDLDGVLYSTEPFLADAYRESIELVNFARVPSSEEIFRHIGWPVPEILARLFPAAAPEAVELIYELSLQVICRRVSGGEGALYGGVPQTLEELRRAGHELVVASNGRRPYVEAVLQTYDLTGRFGSLLAVEPGQIDDKAGLLRAYIDRYRVSPSRLVMVGDRASDVEASLALSCRFVGCDYGHGHRSEIEGRGPIISSLAQLPRVVAQLEG